jgi:hypothetical protein
MSQILKNMNRKTGNDQKVWDSISVRGRNNSSYHPVADFRSTRYHVQRVMGFLFLMSRSRGIKGITHLHVLLSSRSVAILILPHTSSHRGSLLVHVLFPTIRYISANLRKLESENIWVRELNRKFWTLQVHSAIFPFRWRYWLSWLTVFRGVSSDSRKMNV